MAFAPNGPAGDLRTSPRHGWIKQKRMNMSQAISSHGSGPSPIGDPSNGFISVTLPIKRGTELVLKFG
ncbi:hypothetical protein [Brenneria izadpanahii]|uniref:hypothetical protein n=1 Tax=Brenneria izadpanahii TaxID=2722756 RepID=UPI001FE386DA|nr:hypothetical protein [Brenneria izadpanahii]